MLLFFSLSFIAKGLAICRLGGDIKRWGSTLNHLLMGSKMKSCTIHVQMENPKAIGSDVPNLMKDVPNFVKVVPSIPKCIPRWESTPNLFLMGLKMKIMYHPCLDRGLESNRIGCTKFNEGCTKFCEGCTKRSKLSFKIGITPQSLPYEFQNEIIDHPCSDGDP